LRADARRNRSRVLEAAQAAFSDEGLAVPLDEIARRAGVGAGTVYRHFPTKEALFEAVVSERLRLLAEHLRGIDVAEEPGEAFFAFFAHLVEQAVLNKDLCDALESTTGFGFKADLEATTRFRETFAELLGAAQRAGAVRTDVDAEDVKALLVGALAIRRQASGKQADRLVGVLCDGLRP
jgi:AcrR family transcriptional regulator